MLPRKSHILLSLFVLVSGLSVGAENGSYTNTSGMFSTGTAVGQNISVQGAALAGTTASLSLVCPITSFTSGTYQLNWSCAGGTITISSLDNSLAFAGSFLSGSMTLTASGGGRGGHTTYYYQLSGSFSGTITVSGVLQPVYGSLSEVVTTSSQVGGGSAPVRSGSFGWNSAYSPVLIGDAANSRILAADNITGANFGAYGSPGTGVGDFEAISGLAVDAPGRIYASDGALDRIVRFDNLSGKNWVALGSAGSGVSQFSGPNGISIDSLGKIWVADSGNNRIVRFDDMTGKNWTAFGTIGSGVNQFSAPSSIAFDPSGHIYVADAGNNRLVRIDDLAGTNWTTLTQLNIDPYGYPVSSPSGVVVNASGRIFVAAGDYLLSMDDISGTNPGVSYWNGALRQIALDKSGTLYVLGGGFTYPLAQVEDGSGTGYFAAELGLPSLTPSAVAARPVAAGAAVPLLSAKSLSFGTQNVGEPGLVQTVTLTNLGSGPLPITSIASTADWQTSNNCISPLAAAGTCTVSLQFEPTATGSRKGKLTVATTSVHSTLTVSLSGKGVAPGAAVFPTTLQFDPQATETTSGAQSVTLTNPGSGPLTISSILPAGDFSQTGNCPAVLAAGSDCTLLVKFTPTAAGMRSGTVTISDDATPAGTKQTVTLTGVGSTTSPVFTISPESLLFPPEEVGSTSGAQIVTLTNHSSSKVSLPAPTYPPDFKSAGGCGSTLAGGASCTLKVEFAPIVVGSVSESVAIPGTGSPGLALGLFGTGVASGARTQLKASPNPLAFGLVVLGDDSTLTLTVTNVTGISAGIRSIVLAAPAQMKVNGNTCSSLLSSGASCQVKVKFIPVSSVYTYSGTLTVTEDSGTATEISVTGQTANDGG
jgi:hypothetical protein